MIQSILDTDNYKITMQSAICKLFPKAIVRYVFIDRNNTAYPVGFIDELKRRVKHFEELQLTKEEHKWMMQKYYYLDPVYLDFLCGYKFNSNEVKIEEIEGKLSITIEGFWYRTVLWETPLMATISQLYFEMAKPRPENCTSYGLMTESERKANNLDKAFFFEKNNLKVIEFGSRRRYSYAIQDEVIKQMSPVLLGTSNPHFAMKYELTPFGTIAHEFYMYHAAVYGFRIANEIACENWVKVYQGSLGIALPDTFTTDAFYQTFSLKYAKLFDGVRQDSGNPAIFLDKTYSFYKNMRTDPTTKTVLFSDSINCFKKIKEIKEACKTMPMRDSYGIGTWLTNDVGLKPLNIVIKMSSVFCENLKKWLPAIKLSDSSTKHLGDYKTIEICKHQLGIE